MKRRYGLLRFGLSVAVCLIAALLASLQPALSQEVTASIVGTVTDQSGAAIVGATVTAKDVGRGTTWTTQTNTAGVYNLPRVPVGTYTVTVEAKGFERAVHPSVTLVLDQTARLDFQMKVGNVTETVEVTSEAPLLQTDRTELGTIIDANTNVSLPLAARNYIQLTLLAPGAVTPAPDTLMQSQLMTSSGRPYINGNREQANLFLLDGIDNGEDSNNEVGYQPSLDAIQEFNLITQNAPAQFGNFQGGIVNVAIKSGTNQFHGDVFEFLRNDKLNANLWSNNLAGIGRPKLRWNMFGATVGGPIQKDKLFFFADYQGERFDTPVSTQGFWVFPNAYRAGDFGALCPGGFTAGICNSGTQLKDPTNGNLIPNNNLAAYVASAANTGGLAESPVARAWR